MSFKPSRKGDDGTTMILGKRLPKTDKSIKLIGKLDHLQALFGELHALLCERYKDTATLWSMWLCSYNKWNELSKDVKSIIDTIYHINNLFWDVKKSQVDLYLLEHLLTTYEFTLVGKFQYPSYDDPIVAKINTLRTETRQIELYLVRYLDNPVEMNKYSRAQTGLLNESAKYLNRLSSVLYTMMNFANESKVNYTK